MNLILNKYYYFILTAFLVLSMVSCQKGGEPEPHYENVPFFTNEEKTPNNQPVKPTKTSGDKGGDIVGGDDGEDDDGNVVGGDDGEDDDGSLTGTGDDGGGDKGEGTASTNR